MHLEGYTSLVTYTHNYIHKPRNSQQMWTRIQLICIQIKCIKYETTHLCYHCRFCVPSDLTTIEARVHPPIHSYLQASSVQTNSFVIFHSLLLCVPVIWSFLLRQGPILLIILTYEEAVDKPTLCHLLHAHNLHSTYSVIWTLFIEARIHPSSHSYTWEEVYKPTLSYIWGSSI